MMFTLILPHVLRGTDERLPDLNCPAFNQLLRNAAFQPRPQRTAALYQTHLCPNISLPKQSVYASPLAQQIGLNSVTVQHGKPLAITAAEAQTWCEGLNRLYGADACFSVVRPDLWRVDLPYQPDWQIENIFNLNNMLNPDAAPADWLQLFTETQMWLHSHPLNQNRKLYPVNGLWFWNAPDAAPYQACAALACDSVWASHSGADCRRMPEHFGAWQQYCSEQPIDLNQTILFSEAFLHAAEVWEYADEWARWDAAFFAPISAALVSGSLKAVKIVTERGELIIRPPSAWRFWQRAQAFDGKRF